ncbi:MAG: hypothetical protein WC837_04505 [Bellilinea sp.]
MKKWCYVKTVDGHEGYVQVDPQRPLGNQVSDRAAVIVHDPTQQFRDLTGTESREGLPAEFAVTMLLALVVLLIVAWFG